MITNREHHVLSYTDRARLKKQIDLDERTKRGEFIIPGQRPGEGFSERRMGSMAQHIDRDVRENSFIIEERLRINKRVLSEGSPRPLSQNERAEKEKMTMRCKEWLKRRMVPKSQYYVGYNHPEFNRIVQEVQKETAGDFKKVAEVYKQGMREIDPDNPNAGNLENIRPD